MIHLLLSYFILFASLPASAEKHTEYYDVRRPETAKRIMKTYFSVKPKCEVNNPTYRHLCPWYRALQVDQQTRRIVYIEKLVLKSANSDAEPDWNKGQCFFRDASTEQKFQRATTPPADIWSYYNFDICGTYAPYTESSAPPSSNRVVYGPGYGDGTFDIGDQVKLKTGQNAKIIASYSRNLEGLGATFPRNADNTLLFAVEVNGQLWPEAVDETQLQDGEIDEDIAWRDTHTCLRPQKGERFAEDDSLVETWESTQIECPAGSRLGPPDRVVLEVHQGNRVMEGERLFFTAYRSGQTPLERNSYNAIRRIPYFGQGACQLSGTGGGGIGGGGSSSLLARFGSRATDPATMDMEIHRQAMDLCGTSSDEAQKVVFRRVL